MPTQKQIADHLDLSQPEVSKLLNEIGLSARTATLDEVRFAYVRKLRAVAAGHRSHDGLDLTRERVLTEQVDRQIKLFDLAEKRGQLVNVAQLEPELVQMVAAFKTEVLGLPDRLKADLDALYGIEIDLQLLEDLINACLDQLARYDPERVVAAAPAGQADGGSPEDEHDGVGEAAQEDVGEVDG